MRNDEWSPETEPPKKAPVVTIDRRPLSERAKLVDRGLVDFRRVCDQMGILDRETKTIKWGGRDDRDSSGVWVDADEAHPSADWWYTLQAWSISSVLRGIR